VSRKALYSRFLAGLGDRLHFRAHSHHPWPDRSREAHLRAWDDAAAHADEKWGTVFGTVLPEAQVLVARAIGWPDPSLVAFAPNTHEFVARLYSCLPAGRPIRVLTTDSEFHSFARQTARLEEDGAAVTRVPVEPFATFAERFSAAARGEHDLVFVSHVFFNSGHRLSDGEITRIVMSAPKTATVAIDGYHAFMALPMDLSAISSRAFYLAGGYKYAQAGEGCCFLAVPKDCALRPRDTGWFADFAGLEKPIAAPVSYGPGGMRFFGSTFDPAALYRFDAVVKDLDPRQTDAWVKGLQASFLRRLPGSSLSGLALVTADLARCGHFLTFRAPDAVARSARLAEEKGVLTDARGDRLRFGFGLYHDEADLDELFRRL
jgi:kynureninase